MDFTKLMDERRLLLVFVLETLDRRMYRQLYAARYWVCSEAAK